MTQSVKPLNRSSPNTPFRTSSFLELRRLGTQCE